VRLVVVDRMKAESMTPGGNPKSWEGPGVEVGRALVNYSAVEIARIKGQRSSKIEELLGYADSEYVALRENISFFETDISRPVTPSPATAPAGLRSPGLRAQRDEYFSNE